MKRRIRVIVSGRVQGVYFRARTGELAEGLGLSGWVRNLPDGRVEIVGEGDEKLGQLLDWARVGRLAARVDTGDVDWPEPRDENRLRYPLDVWLATLSSDRRSV